MAIRFCACDNERNGKSSPTENMVRRPLGSATVNTVQSSSYATENAASTNLMVSWISRRRERRSPTSSWLPWDGSAGCETVNTVATDGWLIFQGYVRSGNSIRVQYLRFPSSIGELHRRNTASSIGDALRRFRKTGSELAEAIGSNGSSDDNSNESYVAAFKLSLMVPPPATRRLRPHSVR